MRFHCASAKPIWVDADTSRMVSDPMTCQQRHRSGASAPRLRQDCALFLDIDGTLLDIAISPDAVIVPPTLASLLARTSAWLDGALALVSGRPLAEIDALMAPLVLTCAGEHGAIVRLPDNTIEMSDGTGSIPGSWREKLETVTDAWSGVLVEQKNCGIAVHFRMAPERENELRALVDSIVGEKPDDFEVLPAAMAFEIRNRKHNKGEAVRRLMSVAPFAGRVPMFVGDDVTDRDGFHAAERLGGLALDVHEAFSGKPSEVLRWLDASISGN